MQKPIIWMLSGMLAGSVLTSAATVGAEPLQVALSQVKLMVNGSDKTPSGGTYWNGAAQVPLAFNYEGTTYMPIRYISESLGKPVEWDGSANTIWVGEHPSDSVPQVAMGASVNPVPGLPVSYIPLKSALYDAGETNIMKVSIAVKNDGIEPFSFGPFQSQFVGSDGTKYTGSLYQPQGSPTQVDPKSTQILEYYTTLPKSITASDVALHLSKINFGSYPAQYKDWAVIPLQNKKPDAPTYPWYQTGTFDFRPYQLEIGNISSWSYKASTTTQIYKLHVKTTKDTDWLTFPNSRELTFEVIDGYGQSVAQARYAVGSSSNPSVPVMGEGDQYLTFTNIDWSRYYNYGTKIAVYETFAQGKRLLGQFAIN